ncbi:penicillin-binding transpeptidase domain-containing protein [Clostridium oceanicum]|uniref:Penicillin-binding transpeptidase domain-containing protein n=1 Tax=Clostridium oceanicum TaxID=1543 RepID=A0ABN1JVL0_9CLOT
MKVNKDKKFTRFTAFVIIIFFVFIGIVSRLVYLQVLNSQQFKEKANNRSIREIPEAAPRGEILDRNNNVLATNKQNYMLVYNETSESKKDFFKTMNKVFDILDERKQEQTDDFELKINPYRFEFKSDDLKVKKALELRFKKDRGLDEEVRKKFFKGKHKEELTDKDKEKIDEELAKITPKEVFDFLVKQYKIDGKGYSLKDKRRYMIVKDTAKMQRFSGYKPVTIADDISKETATIFLQKLNDLPGIDVTTQPVRYYPNKEIGSAALGYISKISGDRDKYKEKGYDVSSDYIGINGIEGVYEDRLKGSKGGKIVKLNKNGRIVEELGRREPYPGQTLQLTIDKDIQAAAEKSLDDTMKSLRNRGESANATRGAAVAVDVNTGEILALASRPGFDPNIFSTPGKLTPEKYKEFFNPDLAEFGRNYINSRGLSGGDTEGKLNELFPLDKRIKNNKTIREDIHDIYPKPLYNYATMPLIPPGSTFKPMTAIAGLESGAIGQYFSITDNGVFDDGNGFNKKFKYTYGSVDLAKGLAVSSNPYFMSVGQKIRETGGDDLLAKYAWKFGLGVPPNSDVKPATGIEIPEHFGQVFNKYSMTKLYAQQYLWKTMSTLKEGKDSRENRFPSIDLYDRDSDTEKVKEIKTSIKDLIKQSIEEGSKKFNSEEYKKLFKELISEDSAQKNKSIADKQISKIIDVVRYITVSDANSQLRLGANMYNASIGQGMNTFTPLQLANYVATIANGGDRYNLHLVKKILDSDKNVIQDIKPEIAEKTNVSKENIDAVMRGMKEVTGGEGGTAANAFKDLLPIQVAAKTGSADIRDDQGEFGRTSYATLIACAPADNPKIAVSVVVFDGQHGTYVAPVAKAIFEQYFNKDKKADTKSK